MLLVPLVCNRQIHEDLGVPLFADHIRTLTASFDSKLTDVGNLLVRQGPAGQSRPSPAMAKSTKQIAFGSAERLSDTLTEVYRVFLSCKENASV